MVCPENDKKSHDEQQIKQSESKIEVKTSADELSREEQKLKAALAGQYEVIRKLGSGGMASVYLAHETALDRDVAIKLLPEEFHRDKDFVERFKREAQIAAQLEHPNIIRIYHISEDENNCYFVMNYISGGSIGDQIIKRGVLPIHYIIRWGIDICSAVGYAHGHSVIHRDLKPDNIMIDQNAHSVVLDFGIAHAAQGSQLTQKGTVIGSPQYMSPEQTKGIDIDERSDIYSMGVVLYYMATGTLPFQAQDIPSLMYMHVHEIPDSPDLRNPEVPVWLRDIIMKCLAKRSNDRYPSMEELRQALEEHKAPLKHHTFLKSIKTTQQKWSTGQVLDILKKIPMFKELKVEQVKRIFRICSMQKLTKDDILCRAGDESNHIFILIAGSLRATLEDGSQLSRISPLWTVGEMGVFSGEKRSATVIADSECTLLSIQKTELFKVFRNDPVLGKQVAMNINKYLAHKLRINQAIIEELKALCTQEEYSGIIAKVLKGLD